MMFFNPTTELYTVCIIQVSFLANGMIRVKSFDFMNVQGKYYDVESPSNVVRLFCEVFYCVILMIYII